MVFMSKPFEVLAVDVNARWRGVPELGDCVEITWRNAPRAPVGPPCRCRGGATSSTTCTSRGAAVASRRRRDVRAQLGHRRRRRPAATTTAATTRCPSRSSGTPNTAQSATAGWVSQRGLDQLRQHGQPAGADRVVDPAENRQHARIINCANVIGAKPARLANGSGYTGLRYPLASVSPPSTTRPSSMRTRRRRAEPRRTRSPRRSRSCRTCGPRKCLLQRPFGDPGRHRSPADQHGVQLGQCRSSARVASALSSCTATSDTYRRPGPNDVDGGRQFGDVEARRDGDGRGACQRAADQHLQAGDVIARAARTASGRDRPAGDGWPLRWRSTRPPSASPPWELRWCPTSTPRSPRRRRSPRRPAMTLSATRSGGHRRPAPATRRSASSSTSSNAVSTDSAGESEGTATVRRTPFQPPPLRAGSSSGQPLVARRSRTRSISSDDGISLVIWVISTPMSTWSNSPRSTDPLRRP